MLTTVLKVIAIVKEVQDLEEIMIYTFITKRIKIHLLMQIQAIRTRTLSTNITTKILKLNLVGLCISR